MNFMGLYIVLRVPGSTPQRCFIIANRCCTIFSMDIKKKILLIEDDPDQVIIISTRLKVNGFEVVAAIDGQEGLDKISSEKPDIVLLDVNIPIIHGFEVCKQAKSNPETKDIPIIIMSAGDASIIIGESKKAGADKCLSKLYDPQELVDTINQLIG
jgi:DNA-binding response OmpR family regulator